MQCVKTAFDGVRKLRCTLVCQIFSVAHRSNFGHMSTAMLVMTHRP